MLFSAAATPSWTAGRGADCIPVGVLPAELHVTQRYVPAEPSESKTVRGSTCEMAVR